MSLRNRLFALVSVLIFLTVVLVTWTVSSSARQSFAAVDANRTAALIAQFRREFANQREQVSQSVDRVTQSEAVSRIVAGVAASRDFAPYVNDATPLAAAQRLDVLDIVAGDGTIVSSAEWPARFGYHHAWATETDRETGASNAFLQTVELADGAALALVAVRAQPAGLGNLLIAGGRRLDRKFLESLVLAPGMRVLLYQNLQHEISARQLVAADEDLPPAASLEPLIGRVIHDRREIREEVEWPDGPETLDALPLNGPDGTVVGVLLVGSSGRELAALMRRIRWGAIGFGAAAIALGFVVSFIVSARVTRPVEQLADAANAVAGGDWDVRLDDTRTTGEIKVLADAFNTMTRQLVDHRDRLVQAERVAAWRELARRLAHELKNPLFPLRITIDNLRRAKTLAPAEFDEVFDESLTTLQTGLANLNGVIGRFSDFAKMPAPEFSQVSLNEIVEQSAALFRAQLTAPGHPPVTLTLNLDPSVGKSRGDEEQLRRVVQNLLLNAIDAMPHGGELRVVTRGADNRVYLEVSDTGQGLGEEEQSRLFTPYYTTKQHGTGLGLAIVQSVIADHGGRIRVESEPGRGAIFHIELPA
jgi:two-component system, NtrC family, nitrogen regulation sensor histidine kinase NtrY